MRNELSLFYELILLLQEAKQEVKENLRRHRSQDEKTSSDHPMKNDRVLNFIVRCKGSSLDWIVLDGEFLAKLDGHHVVRLYDRMSVKKNSPLRLRSARASDGVCRQR